MSRKLCRGLGAGLLLVGCSAAALPFMAQNARARNTVAQNTSAVAVTPSAMPRVGAVDERFQSYNVEMLEVTGGRFWKPCASSPPRTADRLDNKAPPRRAGPRPRGWTLTFTSTGRP